MRFRGILRGSDPSKLAAWMDNAQRTRWYSLRCFVLFLRRDVEAVRNATSERWSNGQTEGQINRLKTLKPKSGSLPNSRWLVWGHSSTGGWVQADPRRSGG